MKTKKNNTYIQRICALVCAVALLTPMLSGIEAEAAGTEDNTFTFSDTGVTVSGEGTGYTISGTNLEINSAGTYILTGSCADGTVTVKKNLTGVKLILDNFSLTSASTAPIICNSSTEVTIEATGTNTLRDTAGSNADGSVIKSKSASTLTLTGSGVLTLYGGEKNGIKGAAKTAVIVDGITLSIQAAGNALASDGSVTIKSGTLKLESGNDAIKSEPDVDDTESDGTVTINGGNITVVSAGDGIQATGTVTITGGTFNFTTGGGYRAVLGADDSAKGIKSDSEVRISGGTFNLNCADDAIHSNGDVTLTGGTYTIYTGDDAIHADYNLTVGIKNGSGPDITILSCVEGFEGAVITLYSGNTSIVSSDDGINAANSDLTNYTFAIYVYGGYWYINAAGDGIDSNGDIYLYGGVIESFGSSSNADAALDFDGKCYYYGGTLLAVGTSGMAQAPTSGVYVKFGSGNGNGGRPPGSQSGSQSTISITRGSEIVIKNSSGTTLYSATGVKSADSVVFSSESLVSGQTYYLYVNGTQVAAAAAAGTALVNNDNDNPSDSNPTDDESGNGTDTTPQSSLTFIDVAQNSWYYDDVLYVVNKGLFEGTSSTEFSPDMQLTRGMLVTVLWRMEDKPDAQGGALFSDLTQDWYKEAVAWASENQIIKGYGNGLFGPNDNITREQLATILYRYAQYKGLDVTASADLSAYSDVSSISDWGLTAMRWANAKAIINGRSETELAPLGTATRAEAAAIMHRFLVY